MDTNELHVLPPDTRRQLYKGYRQGGLRKRMVGPDRLELSTSVLSGLRSNHLSYGPQWRKGLG